MIALLKAMRDRDGSALQNLLEHLTLKGDRMAVRLKRAALAAQLDLAADLLNPKGLTFDVPWQQRRRGVEQKLIIGDPEPAPDITLVRALAKAHDWVAQLKKGVPLTTLARNQKVTPAFIRTRTRLAFLSPTVQVAIVDGTLSPSFTTNRILSMKIPDDWPAQNSLFGV